MVFSRIENICSNFCARIETLSLISEDMEYRLLNNFIPSHLVPNSFHFSLLYENYLHLRSPPEIPAFPIVKWEINFLFSLNIGRYPIFQEVIMHPLRQGMFAMSPVSQWNTMRYNQGLCPNFTKKILYGPKSLKINPIFRILPLFRFVGNPSP